MSHCLQKKVLLDHYISLFTKQALNILINMMRQFAGKHLNTRRHWFQYLNKFLVIIKEIHQNRMTLANILQASNIQLCIVYTIGCGNK